MGGPQSGDLPREWTLSGGGKSLCANGLYVKGLAWSGNLMGGPPHVASCAFHVDDPPSGLESGVCISLALWPDCKLSMCREP